MAYRVLLFYKYVTMNNPEKIAGDIRVLCQKSSLKGRVIVAKEGINGTLEGTSENTEAFIKWFLSDSRFSDVKIKQSNGDGNTFPKLSVKVRKEIVGTQIPLEEADARVKTSPRLKPEELRSWYEMNKDFVLVDMRNDYEYISGHFRGSIDMGMKASRDLPKATEKIESLKEKTILTVCTGGVRCEKMSAYLLSKGFKDVYQLDGGIHSYMEKYPGKDFLGALYTFDQRIVMNFGGKREIIGQCRLCKEKTENYVNCGNDFCHLHFLACANCAKEEKVFCSNSCRETIEKETRNLSLVSN